MLEGFEKNSFSPILHSTNELQSSLLFRLFAKRGEFLYVRPNDILMLESADHLVKIYLGVGETTKKAYRHNTLKDFLLLLPPDSFVRIGRFCAINTYRLSGCNVNQQTFEFDFRFTLQINHPISHKIFTQIGK